MSKKIIKKELDRLYFDGDPLEVVIKKLQSYAEEYKDYTNLRINEEPVSEGGYYTYLYGDILESDSEYEKRLKTEKEWEERRLERERKQYEELKAKFENETI